MRDAWRLAAGTFLAVPVPPPRNVDREVAGRAMALAPLTAFPAVAVWAVLGVCAVHGWLPSFVSAALALGATALLTRAMHLDGLADTADGLTSGYDRQRALEVMKRGDTGPAGAAALVITLLIQAAALASLLRWTPGVVLGTSALVASRMAPAVACRRGVPSARPGGLGHAVAGTVTTTALGGMAVAMGAVGSVALWLADFPWYAAELVLVAAVVSAWFVTRHAVLRLGGITGDVIGATVELSLMAALVSATVCTAVL